MLLFGAALGTVGDMTYFMGSQDTVTTLALNASTGLTKLHQELRETGNAVVDGISYPNLSSGDTQLHFVTLADPPCTLDGSTELLWDPTVYTLKAENGILGIWEGGTLKLQLCRNVTAATFAIAGRKLTADVELKTVDTRGVELAQRFRRIIVMRN
jgi:hypothetical protein